MQEVQRFNKVLKSCVLLGDLILLNLLYGDSNSFWVTAFGARIVVPSFKVWL